MQRLGFTGVLGRLGMPCLQDSDFRGGGSEDFGVGGLPIEHVPSKGHRQHPIFLWHTSRF